MLDRYGDPIEPPEPEAEDRNPRFADFEEAIEPEPVPDDIWAAEHRAMAIVSCTLCDDEGYRGCMVCDHIDHMAAAERGRVLVQAELEKIRERKAGES